MGRYDGEDFSAQHYAEKSAEEAMARESNMVELVRYLAPKGWKYIARLRPLGYGSYGEFSEEEALKALGRVANRRHLMKAWEQAGLLWPRARPIFRKDLDSCIQLSPSGEQLAEMYGGKRSPTS